MSADKIDDGGPAFPQPMTLDPQRGSFEWPGNGWGIGGMSLRDCFAAHATEEDVRAALGNPLTTIDGAIPIQYPTPVSSAERARGRYLHADAMLAARAKGAQVDG